MTDSTSREEACDELGRAVESKEMGRIVASHTKMIMKYYDDVKTQSEKSFNVARKAAIIGFFVIILSLFYILAFDALFRVGALPPRLSGSGQIPTLGIISGSVIEFIAGIAFVLYARGAKQFGEFHVCLERTHRYLIAFCIAQEGGSEKEKLLRDLACIMANAPMIAYQEQEARSPPPAIDSLLRPVL